MMKLSGDATQAILNHAQNCDPEECCGLIAVDSDATIRFVYPLTNADHSPTSYTIAPEEALGAFLHAESNGWSIGGVFHSHPTGPDQLSNRDLEDSVEGWRYVLISPTGISAWRIRDGKVHELETTTEG